MRREERNEAQACATRWRWEERARVAEARVREQTPRLGDLALASLALRVAWNEEDTASLFLNVLNAPTNTRMRSAAHACQ